MDTLFGVTLLLVSLQISIFFFFNDTATTEIYTLSLHDALPISIRIPCSRKWWMWKAWWVPIHGSSGRSKRPTTFALGWVWRPRPIARARSQLSFKMRSEEHTSELQSRLHLVCRLLLEKKKTNIR